MSLDHYDGLSTITLLWILYHYFPLILFS